MLLNRADQARNTKSIKNMAGIYSSSEKYKPGLVANYENAMKYKLLPVPISFATTEGGRRQTAKSKLLEILTTTLTTPPNSLKLVIPVDPNKSFTLMIDLIAAIKTMAKIPEMYRQLAWTLLGTLPKGYLRIDLVTNTYQKVSIKNC